MVKLFVIYVGELLIFDMIKLVNKMELKEEVLQTEEKLEKLKYQLKLEEEEKRRKEKGRKYFEKYFQLSSIHDDYNFFPNELFYQIKNSFIDNFNDDDSFNWFNLKKSQKEYVENLKTDITILQKEINIILENFKKLQKK